MRGIAAEVLDMKQGFGREPFDVVVVRSVVDPVAIATYRDNPGETQLRKMLRHRRRRHAHMLCQTTDGVFAMQQRPNDPQPRLVSKQLERHHRRGKLVDARLYNSSMRSHADSLEQESVAVFRTTTK